MRICVVGGLGHVGLVTGAGLAELGHMVICVDIREKDICALKEGTMRISEPGLDVLIKKGLASDALDFTTDLAWGAQKAELIFVAVNTPAAADGSADASRVLAVVQDLVPVIAGGQLIVIKSTLPVTGFEQVERVSGQRRPGLDHGLAVNPEFLKEGTAVDNFFHPDRIVIGTDSEKAAQTLVTLYEPFKAPLVVTTVRTALMIKYASNAYLASRVSFINEIANICEAVGADIGEVVRGMGYDRRIGHHYLSPGLGFAGPCLPKDLSALCKMAEECSHTPKLLEAVLDQNERQLSHILSKVEILLGHSFEGRTVAVLGLAFKPETSDVRNSRSLQILEYLIGRGVRARAYDPATSAEARACLSGVVTCSTAYEATGGSDLLLILTAWPEFRDLDYEEIRRQMRTPVIFDAVNALEPGEMRALGFDYHGIARNRTYP